MATRHLSPGGQLLRSSRLFSLPPPLPEPPPAPTQSPTATLRYPTRQAIVTPTSSQHRGDWGGKRPLPTSYTSKSSGASIRITELDTRAQVTNFDLANDHVRTLQKWQEMRVPLVQRQHRINVTGRVASGESASAFDRYTDITDPEEVQTLWERERKAATRWKYDGDSVVGMTQGDFQMFINKQLRQPELRRRFTAWLKDRIISDEVSRVKEEHAREHGAGKFDETEWLSSRDLDKVFSDHLKNLRDEGRSKDPLATKKETGFQFGSTLSRYLEEFLDLPRFASTSGKAEPAITPTTHPSAGLSYMRNKMYIENHPLLGPRAEPQPVRARVLSATPHILDIGGVVAEKRSGQPPRGGVDFNIEGGPKKYVVPKNAWVRPDGRIDIDIGDVKPDARSEEVIEEDRRWKEKNVPDYFKKRKVVQV